MNLTPEQQVTLDYARQQKSNALMCQMVDVVESLMVAPLVAATDNEPAKNEKYWKGYEDGYKQCEADQVAPQATELDSVTISKMNTLRENGMRQVGVVMMDDSGKRATIDMGKVLWSTSKADTGEAIHYPECWDTATYPTLQDAIRAIGAFKCANYDGQHDGAIRNAALEEAAGACEQSEIPFDIQLWCESTKREMTAHTAIALAGIIRALKSATPSTIKADLRHNQKIFTVDILRQPMREYAPGKWENCIWPSDSIKAEAHPQNDLIQVVDRYLSAAYQAGMDGDEFDMLTPKREIAALAAIKTEPTGEQL